MVKVDGDGVLQQSFLVPALDLTSKHNLGRQGGYTFFLANQACIPFVLYHINAMTSNGLAVAFNMLALRCSTLQSCLHTASKPATKPAP